MQIIFQHTYQSSQIVVGQLDSFEEAYANELGLDIDWSIKIIEKQFQSKGALYLLEKELGVSKDQIVKDELGKPFIKDDHRSISISHCGHFVSVVLSEKRCGLDLEFVGDRIQRIQHKFTTEAELDKLKFLTHSEACHMLWGGKEALYKIYGKKKVEFSEELFVWAQGDRQLKGEVKKEEQIYCSGEYQFLKNDLLLVYFEED